MSKIKLLAVIIIAGYFNHSCAAKKGCPTNGKNIGAEKLATGDPKSEKQARKAGKFRYGKLGYK